MRTLFFVKEDSLIAPALKGRTHVDIVVALLEESDLKDHEVPYNLGLLLINGAIEQPYPHRVFMINPTPKIYKQG
jgi:hypothetical protein